jgi:Trk K+ transport system NAD-binding subunit
MLLFYSILFYYIEGNSRFVGKSLLESNLKNQHIQVINVDKGNFKVEFPSSDYKIERGDKLLVYGKKNNISRAFDLK